MMDIMTSDSLGVEINYNYTPLIIVWRAIKIQNMQVFSTEDGLSQGSFTLFSLFWCGVVPAPDENLTSVFMC